MTGPKRSTLQAMLANLESEDDLPALQSGAASPPRGGNNNVQELEQTGMCHTSFDTSRKCDLTIINKYVTSSGIDTQ